jgi:hypothetical protein
LFHDLIEALETSRAITGDNGWSRKKRKAPEPETDGHR